MTSGRPAPQERSPRAAQIIAAARGLLEQEGRAALTMRRLALLLGIRAPSIYKHLPGKHAVEVALIEEGMAEMGDTLHRVISHQRAPADGAVAALLAAYRAEALAHPNLYRLATAGQLPRSELAPGLEDWAGEPWFLAAGDSYLAQALWSFAHGMVILELDGRYPAGSDLDRTWRAGAESFARTARPTVAGERDGAAEPDHA
ncbi:MAG TPA: TetR-like C-terminal domain-containing protein [Streptosporangiaceae bacterium]